MKYFKSIISRWGLLLCAATLTLGSLSSCSDDETKTPLAQPTVTEGAKTVSSLSFNWEPVAGASQYAYELYDADGNVVLGAVTTTTTVIATGLKPNCQYTLKVWAYSPVDGKSTTSPIATITATTNAQTQLATPATPDVKSANGGVTITWPAVEHATEYKYSYEADGQTYTGTTETNSVTITGLAIGEYTMTIIATSSDENYSDSEPLTLTFNRTKAELWRQDGVYTSDALGQKFNAQIVAYDDGSYTIEAPYGDADYSISFSLASGSSQIVPLDYYAVSGGYYFYYVSSAYTLGIYADGGYSSFTGDKKSGEVWFYELLYAADGSEVGSGYGDFTWGGSQEMTVDDLCGDYSAAISAYDYFSSNWTLQEVSGTCNMSIKKNDDGTINISNFYNWDEDFTGTVDLGAKTITIQPTTWATYYTFADISSATTPVVGTIADDGTITFQNFTAWYGGYSYIESDARLVMTKK